MKAILVLVLGLGYLPFVNTSVRADDSPEVKKIEALIKHIDGMDASFVRNDQKHDAKAWAKYMRIKWERSDAQVKTARDFIDKVASKSSTSNKPYLIRFKDGKEQKLGEYLLAELKKIENPPTEKEKR